MTITRIDTFVSFECPRRVITALSVSSATLLRNSMLAKNENEESCSEFPSPRTHYLPQSGHDCVQFGVHARVCSVTMRTWILTGHLSSSSPRLQPSLRRLARPCSTWGVQVSRTSIFTSQPTFIRLHSCLSQRTHVCCHRVDRIYAVYVSRVLSSARLLSMFVVVQILLVTESESV